ncbi:M50 family metallopeptidase [uncultured Kordia sp.]|uniref:M50 family metallopeptidase n=1 Tax=uncultured Kordia sp. TaxID=507699 RepID=UPI0026199E6E|nr:M50 family metallopeptidase [uncultured Kordia sp.]
MMLLAVLFQNIGKFLCLKLFKTKLRDLRKQWHWKRFVYELSGSIFLFLLSFIIYASIMMYYGKVYLSNDNLIYGIEASEVAEHIGFQDGDKLIAINGEKITEFDAKELMIDVLLTDSVHIDLTRDSKKIRLSISEEQKKMILANRDSMNQFIMARNLSELEFTHENYSVSEITARFYKNLETTTEYVRTLIIGPEKMNGYLRRIPVAIFEVHNFLSFLSVFSFTALMLVIINLIPLPGLDAGNMIIALMEHNREKVFSAKKLFIIRLLGIGILIIWVLINTYLL